MSVHRGGTELARGWHLQVASLGDACGGLGPSHQSQWSVGLPPQHYQNGIQAQVYRRSTVPCAPRALGFVTNLHFTLGHVPIIQSMVSLLVGVSRRAGGISVRMLEHVPARSECSAETEIPKLGGALIGMPCMSGCAHLRGHTPSWLVTPRPVQPLAGPCTFNAR